MNKKTPFEIAVKSTIEDNEFDNQGEKQALLYALAFRFLAACRHELNPTAYSADESCNDLVEKHVSYLMEIIEEVI